MALNLPIDRFEFVSFFFFQRGDAEMENKL